MNYMDAFSARQAVAEAGRLLLSEGLVARTWGNVSCRTGADSFAITPSGLGYEAMKAEDVVLYRMTDGSCEGARKPSSEKGVHAAAYARFPDAGFVIHTHQCYASALGLAGFERLAPTAGEKDMLGGVALARYGLPGTKKLSGNVAAAMEGGAHCILMAHHGALIAGENAQEAFRRAQLLESLCRAACQGQPEHESAVAEALAGLCGALGAESGMRGFTAHPAVAEASRMEGPLPAQLDDMAQMIGARLTAVPPEPEALERALGRHAAVLVRGLGAVCRAGTEGDVAALKLLTEKACVAFLHTRACGKRAALSRLDTALMRRIYIQKYEKKIGG